MKKSCVKVFIRIRPSQETPFIAHTENTVTVSRNSVEHTYTFDRVFGPLATTRTVYQHLTFNEDGNNTILCYGNTSSGKSYTMVGSEDAGTKGLVQMAAKRLLAAGAVQVCYFEIYKDSLQCLLTKREVALREKNGAIELSNIEWVDVKSYVEFKRLLDKGLVNRKVGSTCLNTHSSRSHTILQIRTARGKVSLVDLAGSEDNRRTGNHGSRMEESSSINTSLFVLGKVVKAIVSKDMRIPYRDSKLTRVLQDSLGGNARTRKVVNKATQARRVERETVFDRLASGKSAICMGRDVDRQSMTMKRPRLRFAGSTIADARQKARKPKECRESVLSEKNRSKCTEKAAERDALAASGGSCERGSGGREKQAGPSLRAQGAGDGVHRKETDLFLTPDTKSKSYKAFYLRALNYELSGQTKKALADYRTLEKISSNEVVREKIRALTRASPTKKVTMGELLEILNSGDFIRTKSLKGVGDKRAQRIVEYVALGKKFCDARDLCNVFSSKIVDQILSSVEKAEEVTAWSSSCYRAV
ncbi:UNVERIFIED_CONTAM: hypothetical protein PYX00_011790 [Menopon gallinae]|uniref:Kinesin-like protein n=1 Tax=Menopon gallinae TaxID=328185 RepID=A0AAW2H969_9NEOP